MSVLRNAFGLLAVGIALAALVVSCSGSTAASGASLDDVNQSIQTLTQSVDKVDADTKTQIKLLEDICNIEADSSSSHMGGVSGLGGLGTACSP